MEKWIVYAFVSMVFARFTSVIAKLGLTGISGDLGLTIRTCFAFVFVLMFAAVVVPASELQGLTGRNLLWLGLSGVTTACSWVFCYRAIKREAEPSCVSSRRAVASSGHEGDQAVAWGLRQKANRQALRSRCCRINK